MGNEGIWEYEFPGKMAVIVHKGPYEESYSYFFLISDEIYFNFYIKKFFVF